MPTDSNNNRYSFPFRVGESGWADEFTSMADDLAVKVPSFGPLSARPNPGQDFAPKLYASTDESPPTLYLNTGAQWVAIAEGGGSFSGSHTDLSNVQSDQHHPEYTDAKAQSALEGTSPTFTDVTSDSLNTQSISGTVLFAHQYSGANGGEMIQAAIDDASANHDAATVVVNGGPDDLSGEANAVRGSGYRVTQTILHKSNVTLLLVDAYLWLEDSINDNVIRNENATSGDTTRDTNLNIEGIGDAFIDGNPDGNTDSTVGRGRVGIDYFKVDTFSIEGIAVRAQAWALTCEDFTNGHYEDIEFRQKTNNNGDGIKPIGPLEGLTATNLRGTTSDDLIRPATWNDNATGSRGPGGDVNNVVVSNVNVESLSGGSVLGTRVQDGPNGENWTIDGVYGYNLHHRNTQSDSNSVKIGYNQDAPEISQHKNIVIDGLWRNGGSSAVSLENPVENLTVKNVQGHGNRAINVKTGIEVRGLTMDSIRMELQSGTREGLGFFGPVSDFTVTDVRFTEASGISAGGLHFSSQRFTDGTIRDVRVNTTGTGVIAESGAVFNRCEFDDWLLFDTSTRFDIAIPNEDFPLKESLPPWGHETGLHTVSGDGTTTDFLLTTLTMRAKENEPSFHESMQMRGTPISADAIGAGPMILYLDHAGSGTVWEEVRVKFASAPPSGTDNVQVRWDAELID